MDAGNPPVDPRGMKYPCAKHPLLVAAPHWAATIQLAEDVGAVRDAGAVAML